MIRFFFTYRDYSGCSKKKKKKLIVESRAAAIIKGRYAVCLDEESGAYVESGTTETRELVVKC